MWQNYSQWTGEARERYDTDMSRLRTLTGTSEATRQTAIDERQAEFDKEMKGFETGATGSQLRQHWQTEGGGAGTLEDFMSGRYGGGYQPPAGPTGQGGGTRRAVAAADPRAAAMAPVSGVGNQRQWWAF